MRTCAALFVALILSSGCNCGGHVNRVDVRADAAPRSIDFGLVAPGSSVTRTVTLTAHGAAVKLDRFGLSDDTRGSFSIGPVPATLGDGAPVQVEISYSPKTEGADSATATAVFASEGLDDLVIALVGRSLAGGVDAGADAGVPDAGVPDAGPIDSGVPDAGPVDAGPVDAGPVDAGPVDSGTPDSGMPVDAGRPSFDGGGCPGTETFGFAAWPAFGAVNLPQLHWEGSDWVAFFYNAEGWYGRVNATGHTVAGTLSQVTPGLSSLSSYARAARGPSEWGIVYSDDRGGLNNRQVYFARVTASGAIVPGSEVPVGPASHDSSASIAFNPLDGEWGVMWGASSNTIGFVRLSAAGAVISGSQVTLSTTATSAYRVEVSRDLVWAGSRWVAVWPEMSGLILEEIDRTGAPVAASRTPIVTTGGPFFDPAVTASPTQYGVVWQDNTGGFDTRFARVSFGGGLVAGSSVSLSGVGSADVVWDGAAFFIVYSIQPTSPGTDQRVALSRVSATGQVLTHAQMITCGPAGSGNDFFPSVTWNGSVHAVAYARQYAPMGVLTQEGRVLLIP